MNRPEIPPGKVLICYATKETYPGIGWDSKERGTGLPRDLKVEKRQKRRNYFPVYVRRSEVAQALGGLDTLRRTGVSHLYLQELIWHSARLYNKRNDIFLPDMRDRIDFLGFAMKDVSTAIQKGYPDDFVVDLAGRMVSRIFCIVNGYTDLPLVSVMARKFPHTGCTYCNKKPCDCELGRRKDYKLCKGPAKEQLEWSLTDWCTGLGQLYGDPNRAHGMSEVLRHLGDEITELRQIRRLIENMDAPLLMIEEKICLELADVLAWTIGVANMHQTNMENKFLARYGNGCLKCHEKYECSCGRFEMKPLDL